MLASLVIALYAVVGIVPNGSAQVRIAPSITTVAGSTSASGGTLGAPLQSDLGSPTSVARDSKGNLYIADSANNRVLKMTSD